MNADKLDTHAHGGDYSGTLLDFSVNVSPLGVPDAVRVALSEAVTRADRYPDPLCRDLRAAIGAAENIPPDWILCGNGASDLIYRAALAIRPKHAIVTAPAFSEYEAALSLSDCEITRYPLSAENGFRLDADFLNAFTPGTNVIFLCQPNNPTGVTIPQALLFRVLEHCRETGCRLILDECFLGFLDCPEQFTLRGKLPDFPNLLLLRAFTKLYGLAGVRLGYALCADAALLEQMRRCGPPWNVSELAQAAGVAALRESAYVDAVRRLVSRERPKLYADLSALGLRVIPGEANFLLFRSPAPLSDALRERGILVRNCGNFHGLDDTWYRVAVRTEAENRRLIAALREVLCEKRNVL
ncbi:MAG: aminotransferase class I/II-fold pyridoxal phosphate-dependent enzyme [Oscillospiraceae bacterium]|nr:aminotransferase class I/II-fold pyridoxal phosphate-dependent enzyme [Oscillospiraceae bacterium]